MPPTAREQLAAAPEGEPVSDAVVQRLNTLRPEVDILRVRETDLAKQVAALDPTASAQVPDEDLLPLADRIAGVLAGVPVQRQRLEEDPPKSLSGLRAAEALLGSTLAPLGEEWTEERLAAFPLSSLRSADIDAFAQGFEGWRLRRIQSETNLQTCAEAIESARADVTSRRAAGADMGWLEAEGEVRSLAASAGAHRSRVDRLERLAADLRQATANLEGVRSRLGPAWDAARVMDFSAQAEWRRVGEDAATSAERVADERRKGQLAAEEAETQAQVCRDEPHPLERPTRAASEVEQAVRSARAEIACRDRLPRGAGRHTPGVAPGPAGQAGGRHCADGGAGLLPAATGLVAVGARRRPAAPACRLARALVPARRRRPGGPGCGAGLTTTSRPGGPGCGAGRTTTPRCVGAKTSNACGNRCRLWKRN